MKVFVDVDTQCDFVNQDGNLYVPGAKEIKPVLEKLTKLAKDENIRVIKTMDAHLQNDPEFKVFPPHCIVETVGQASIRETANKRAIIFEKQTYDVFDKTLGNDKIDGWLKDNKVTEAWVYGLVGNICIEAAVMGLLARGIKVYVFENAVMWMDMEQGIFCTGVDNKEQSVARMRKAGAVFAQAKL